MKTIYFTTASILNWQPLLLDNAYKHILIESLQYLTANQRLIIFAYVIMPNHLHIIWVDLENKNKESAMGSFFKFTAHAFLKKLSKENSLALNNFLVDKADRKYQFWQRNKLDIEIYNEKVFEQKLEYIHDNPVQPKWKLVEKASDYRYSSASFYNEGLDEFNILSSYYLA